jgi:DNA-binding ferritin-like protein
MSHAAKILQPYGEYGKNPIGLPEADARAVGERLDALCASEYVLFHQAKKHHWMVVGAEYLPVHQFLDAIADHARLAGDRLAERVTALGGVPTGSPKNQQEHAVFSYEETEDAVDARTMLERDLAAEQAMIAELRKVNDLARDRGDAGSAYLLQGLLLEHEDEAHHLDHWLEHDSLVAPGRPAR